jgi:co-chaperonin GroES (HSP10)
MKIQAFGRRIYIRPEQEKTLIQSEANSKIVRGVVVSTGPEVKDVEVGDVLLFTSWGVDEVEIDKEKHYFLIESDEFILARIPVLSGQITSISAWPAGGAGGGGNMHDLPQEGLLYDPERNNKQL